LPSIDLRPRPNRNPRDKRPPRPLPFDVALRKFRKAVERAGIIQDLKKKEFYEKPTAKRRRKKQEAVARWKKQERSLARDMSTSKRRKY